MSALLDGYLAQSADEAHDLERIRALVDPWPRSTPLHVTGSAVIVHPATQRVLLRWHDRMQGWLQVGGHADPGESDPLAIALREAEEETGLRDLSPWPDARIIHVAVVPVPPGKGEPAHEHADVRYALATDSPESIQPETESALLKWLLIEQAIAEVGEDNLRVCLNRIATILV